MSASPIWLRLIQFLPADPATGRVPTEQYAIVERESGQPVGGIRLRLSHRFDVVQYAGHVGYNVDAAFRGRRYAALACLELKPIAQGHGFRELWITCDPDNESSRRTCERIGAELIEIVDLPPDLDMYQDGERQKCRYRWQLE